MSTTQGNFHRIAAVAVIVGCAGAVADDRSNEQRRASTIASQIALAGNPYSGPMAVAYQMQQQANAQAAAQNEQGSNRSKSPPLTVPKIEMPKFDMTLPEVTAPSDTNFFGESTSSSGSGRRAGLEGDGDISSLIAEENDKIAQASQETSALQQQIANTQIAFAEASAQTALQLEAMRAQSRLLAEQNRSRQQGITAVEKPKPTEEEAAKAAAKKAEDERLRQIRRDPIAAALTKSVSEMYGVPSTVAAGTSGTEQIPTAPGHANTLGGGGTNPAAAQVISLRP